MNHQKAKWLINLTLSLILLVAIFMVKGNYNLFWVIVLLVYVVQWGLFKWLSKH